MIRTEITGETKVWRNDDKGFAQYTTSIGKKNQEGNYDNAYIEVKFKKGVNIENGTVINIAKGFLTFRQYEKDNKKFTVWQIMVLDFDTEYMDSDVPQTLEDKFTALNEEVPF